MPKSIKRINGHDYLYYTSYIDGKRDDTYCGPASKKESKQKCRDAEIRYLEKQIERYEARLSKIVGKGTGSHAHSAGRRPSGAAAR